MSSGVGSQVTFFRHSSPAGWRELIVAGANRLLRKMKVPKLKLSEKDKEILAHWWPIFVAMCTGALAPLVAKFFDL
jgi:hypothetical protein